METKAFDCLELAAVRSQKLEGLDGHVDTPTDVDRREIWTHEGQQVDGLVGELEGVGQLKGLEGRGSLQQKCDRVVCVGKSVFFLQGGDSRQHTAGIALKEGQPPKDGSACVGEGAEGLGADVARSAHL